MSKRFALKREGNGDFWLSRAKRRLQLCGRQVADIWDLARAVPAWLVVNDSAGCPHALHVDMAVGWAIVAVLTARAAAPLIVPVDALVYEAWLEEGRPGFVWLEDKNGGAIPLRQWRRTTFNGLWLSVLPE